jgi:tetratricopeptide (TPR) repeat protein
MTQPRNPSQNPGQVPLPQLLAQYLERQRTAHASGLVLPEGAGEVELYDAGPAQAVEPRLAWDEAGAALGHFHATPVRAGKTPPEWPLLVASHEPVAALAFAAGNFPQLVRDLHALLHATDRKALRPAASRPVAAPALLEWAEKTLRQQQFPQGLLALGALRLGKHFDRAAELVEREKDAVPEEWRAAWANEEAALAWHRGRSEEAAALWQAQEARVPVLFNRGMAALFLDRPGEARAALRQATDELPESGAWHHLGRLYLGLAEMRG